MNIGPDAPTVTNESGGKQSMCPVELVRGFPHSAVLQIGEVIKRGGEKYGWDNWRLISRAEHLNHALTHLHALCSGDTQDSHLVNAACRILMALETK